MKKIVILLIFTLFSSSCVVVKEYDKVYLNDDEMMLIATRAERFETIFQVYREAASGANGGKSGCGCN